MYLKKLLSNPLISGTLLLTAVGVFTRIIGFLFRIFLSKTIGEEGMGIYQLAMPVINICLSASALSLQTALSRLIAAYNAKETPQDSYLLRAAIAASLILSGLFIVFLYPNASWICEHFLKEIRCTELFQMLLLSIPFSCIHTCICGYYYGRNHTKQPAFSQFVEQTVRIGTIFLIWRVRFNQASNVSLTDIAMGSVISELASALYLTLAYRLEIKKRIPRIISYTRIFKELSLDFLPLSANRICITVLQTAESILIPVQLRLYGMTSSQALSIFGVLTGMSLPFILFPSTLANSAAVLLLPKIASDTAAGSREQVKRSASMSILLIMSLGFFCFLFFLITGPFLGTTFFQSKLAGHYIRALSWLCPFLYLGITCGSILNGMGKLSTVFMHNLTALLIRLACVFFLIPIWGINGYLTGLLTSQLVLCVLHLLCIKRRLFKKRQTSA